MALIRTFIYTRYEQCYSELVENAIFISVITNCSSIVFWKIDSDMPKNTSGVRSCNHTFCPLPSSPPCSPLNSGHQILDTGYSSLAARHWILVWTSIEERVTRDKVFCLSQYLLNILNAFSFISCDLLDYKT
jgi:hypothetical protein